MLTIYIVSGVIGVGLALLAAFGAIEHGHDIDFNFGHDADIDSGGDVDHDGVGHWIPFFSLRFWTYAFGGFGLAGVLLTYFGDIGATSTFWVSIVTGLVCGLMVAVLMRYAAQSEAQSNARADELLGTTAKVLVTVRQNQAGRVRCHHKGEIIDILAVSDEDVIIQPGEEAIIVGVEDGRATVVPVAALTS